MRTTRTFVILTLVLGLAVPGFAQSLADQAQAVAAQTPVAPSVRRPAGKTLVLGGAALFAAGMSTALYGFIRVGNGEYSTFGEASSRNKPLGAAGLAAAFAGGTMMYLGSRARRFAPSVVSVSSSGLAVEKVVTW